VTDDRVRWRRPSKPFEVCRRIICRRVPRTCTVVAGAAATPFLNRDLTMFQNSSASRRFLARIGLGIGAAVAATLAIPGTAQAHVTVQPGTAQGGGFSVVSFRVPNERDDASTTQVRVSLPEDQPIGSVKTTPISGWKITTATRHPDTPIEMFGEKLDTVVSEVTWTATNGGISPGQFQDFDLSLGQLPESGDLVFNTLQTYSSGEKVNWNEISADPSIEPEHPAPILTITPSGADESSGAIGDGSQASQDELASTAQGVGASAWTLPLVVSGAALLLSLVSIAMAWRRGWRPGAAAEAGSVRAREDVNL
jgi:uncharacterized protein YcnI